MHSPLYVPAVVLQGRLTLLNRYSVHRFLHLKPNKTIQSALSYSGTLTRGQEKKKNLCPFLSLLLCIDI